MLHNDTSLSCLHKSWKLGSAYLIYVQTNDLMVAYIWLPQEGAVHHGSLPDLQITEDSYWTWFTNQ